MQGDHDQPHQPKNRQHHGPAEPEVDGPAGPDPAHRDADALGEGAAAGAGKADGTGNDREEISTLANAEATLKLAGAWFDNLQTLFRLELDRTLVAGRRILALQLMLVPLALMLLLSTCGGIGLLAYFLTQSIYIGFTAFFIAQLALLALLVLYMKKLQALLGFSETQRQAREAFDNVLETIK